ncbi:MAG: PAS domain S-box protein [Filimonas sp.]|nr:PAS domain S-box protein [Filimonas sp.]
MIDQLHFSNKEAFQTGNPYQRSLLDAIPVAIYTCNMDGYVQLYNNLIIKLFGREPIRGEDRFCCSWRTFNTDGTVADIKESPTWQCLFEGKDHATGNTLVQRPDNSFIQIRIYAERMLDDKGTLIGTMNTVTDITDQAENEAKLAYLASIVKSSHDAIISKTLDGIVTSWNNAAEQIFGYTAEEMIGQSITRLIPPDRQNEEPQIIARILRGEQIDHFETRRIHKTKKYIDVSLTISPIKNEAGKIIGASKIARDITQQKIFQKNLQETKERYRLAVATTGLGSWEIQVEEKTILLSKECRDILGIHYEGLLTLEEIKKYLHPVAAERIKQKFADVFSSPAKEQYDFEFRIIRHDGAIRWVRTRTKIYFNPDQTATRCWGTLIDVTEERIATEALEAEVSKRTSQLIDTNRQLERSNNDLEQFAYIASHDLQEPLRKIQTFINLIERNESNPELRAMYYEKVVKAANRMSTLVRDVLNYSRLSNKLIDNTTVDLNEIVEAVKQDCELTIAEKQAKIINHGLPAIEGNSAQLQQLFSNLVSNALKFSSSHPLINISASLVPATDVQVVGLPHGKPVNQYHRILISDNGIGFEKEFAKKIFEIFQRLETQSRFSGTGIGLAVCKKIVENHGGSISADSTPGQGSVFEILLPA